MTALASTADPRRSVAALCLAGVLALAVAMGIGRFAFTPVLPLMVRDGLLSLGAAGWLAAANYAGYLAGALSASRLARSPARLVRRALFAVALLTAAMAVVHGLPGWLLLRFAAGMASAWVLVGTSAWALPALAAAGRAALGATVFAGVGLGIALAGLQVWWADARGAAAPAVWLELGAVALAGAVAVVWLGRGTLTGTAAAPAAAGEAGTVPQGWSLVLCYGLAAFGYILPATFLPAMARTMVSDPRLFGLAWPVFGAAAALSTVAAGRWLGGFSRTRVWAGCHGLLALGAVLPVWQRSGLTLLLAALLVGGTFMVITMLGLQEIRARSGAAATAWLGRMTTAFALGQIAGPVASSLLSHGPRAQADALSRVLLLAAVLLVLSAAWLWRLPFPPTSERSRR